MLGGQRGRRSGPVLIQGKQLTSGLRGKGRVGGLMGNDGRHSQDFQVHRRSTLAATMLRVLELWENLRSASSVSSSPQIQTRTPLHCRWFRNTDTE